MAQGPLASQIADPAAPIGASERGGAAPAPPVLPSTPASPLKQASPGRWRAGATYRYGLAIAIVLAAASVRMLFLQALGMRTAFITFYPAVILAALNGGLGAGLLATVLSALLADYFWMQPAGAFTISDPGDQLALAIFLASGVMISWLTKAMRQAQARAAAADLEARLAAGRALEAEALRESERFARATIDALEANVCVTDDRGVILAVNQAWRAYAAANGPVGGNVLEGANCLAVCDAATGPHAEDAAAFAGGMRAVLRGDREAFSMEYACPSPTEQRWFTVRVTRFSGAGPTRLVIAHEDTTERKRAEESLRESEARFRLAASGAHAMVYDLDMRTTRAATMYGLRELLGYEPCQINLTVDWWYQRTLPEDRELCHAAFQRMRARGQGHTIQYRIRHKDGRTLWVEDSSTALHDASGELVRVVGTVLDITERKRAEEDLKAARLSAEQARAAAEAASKSKDHFIAVLSHELRNPLSPVLATASMLRDDPRFDADTREQLEIICRNAEMEARLIDDLLDVTRIERGKVELDRRPVELRTIIRRAVEVCLPDLNARKLELSVDAADGPYPLDADAGRIQQVFWNLLSNAIKFTPPGGCVEIRCRRDRNGFVIVQVSDTGEGIEPSALGLIFNAFEQAGRDITRQFGGLGLGLTISKAMVELHGGTIDVHSEGKGKGATFTLRLPLCDQQAGSGVPTHAGEAAGTAAVTGPEIAARKLRILLVEDHGDTARAMGRVLAASGHEVQAAPDVATALQLTGQQSFDLVLSDLGLPDGSGLDLMRTLRQRGLTLPGIALSGYGQERDVQQSRAAGFAAHLTKPVSMPRLKETIHAVVRMAEQPGIK